MDWSPPSPTPDDLKNYFPGKIKDPEDGTFELALTLGGTVSAGAYTAGVVDFLFEALDAWKADPQGPNYNTVLKVVTGASGGAVCAAITSILTGYDFPHGPAPANPLYNLWVNTLDIHGMLDTGDIKHGKPLASLLNVAPLEQGSSAIVNFNGNQRTTKRAWLDDTLSTIVTLTNLRGVPFATKFGTGKEVFVNHADFARFQVATTATGVPASRPDAFNLNIANIQQRRILSECAIASGAFPVGFVARGVTKPMSQYAYGVVVLPGSPDEVVWQTPDWDSMKDDKGNLPAQWDFACYDGGALDNEPIQKARRALNGYVDRIPRNGIDTKRAVLLVDPFAEPAGLGPDRPGGCLKMAGTFVSSLISQGRYDTCDLMLAADPNKYSRFLINAQRGNVVGGKAICSAGLGAFQGFLCREFRHFDYMLGRQNAYDYLKEVLTLPPTNPLFNNWTDAEQRAKYATSNGELPIIPLVDGVKRETLPEWPAHAFNPDDLHDAIHERVSKLISAAENELLEPGWLTKALLWVGLAASQSEKKATEAAISAMKESLEEWGLR